ncbi:MAG: hypothetical protein V4584_13585 [Verrucomicrobiota bacterium]
MGKLTAICLGMILTPCAFAQSAANFSPEIVTTDPATPAESKAAKPVPKEAAPPVSASPSRMIGPAEIESYVSSLSSVFLIGSRTRDPFGQNQDPDAKPVIKESPVQGIARVAPTVTPFPEIVQMITVNTIMPGEKRFLIMNRSFKQGDQIPFLFRNKPVRVQVAEVTSRKIVFRNLDTGEIAERKLDMLPVGMTPGTHGITAPGMAPDRPSAPIELGAGDTAP